MRSKSCVQNMIKGQNDFYTMKGYQISEEQKMTPAMEDYLEMISRMSGKNGESVRVRDLSGMLHVRPSSASKMVQQLRRAGYILAEPYGTVLLTEKGRAEGQYLLYRHDVIRTFLILLNGDGDTLTETEKIEHFLSKKTVENLDRLIRQMKDQ